MLRPLSLALGVVALATITGPAGAQTLQRRATLRPGGSPDRGQCTIEVVVDGAAEVEIRGDNGTLRNLSGQPPQWRRFECTGVMPANAPNFRFSGVDGRGSQELVRDPRQGGVAVVRIQDSQGGAEGYTFDLTWGGGGYQNSPPRGYPATPEREGSQPRGYQDRGRGDSRDDRPRDRRFTTEEAVRVCQQAVRDQAAERFHTGNIAFRRTSLDDNPGRQDWVMGIVDVRRGYDQDEAYRFSCSVNFDTGAVRSVQLEPMQRGWYRPGYGDRGAASNLQAMESCERAVEERVRRDGYQHVDFLEINVENRPGGNDWIVGNARADRQYRSDSFRFSCAVNLDNGVVRSVSVERR
jgi:hypothetical protein